MGKYSFIGDLVQNGSKAAKEVVEGAGGTANQRAKMIKNCVNTVQSNLGGGQARAVAEMGEDSGRALKEGIQNAVNQTKAKTANKALNRTARQGNAAVQKSKEIIDSKRVNQIIDGHNAKQRDVDMQTIFNNVKDRAGTRAPKDRTNARNAVNNAYDTVNARRARKEAWMNNSQQGPIINNTNVYQGNTGPQASPIIRNAETPNTAQQIYHRQPEVNTSNGPEINKAVEPEFDTKINNTNNTNNANTETKRNKAKERMNRAFDKAFGNASETIKDTFAGGIMDSYSNIKNTDMGIMEAIGKAHTNDDGSINWRRAAGTFMTASAAARVASGGGVYKDRYGNPNLIGVPFI